MNPIICGTIDHDPRVHEDMPPKLCAAAGAPDGVEDVMIGKADWRI
jgi:hypothetical protein